MKVLARKRAASIIGSVPARSHVASEPGHGGQNMRVHFQQLTEPIAFLVENQEPFAFSLTFEFQSPTQSKSQASRSRRLQVSTTRACGDPIGRAARAAR